MGLLTSLTSRLGGRGEPAAPAGLVAGPEAAPRAPSCRSGKSGAAAHGGHAHVAPDDADARVAAARAALDGAAPGGAARVEADLRAGGEEGLTDTQLRRCARRPGARAVSNPRARAGGPAAPAAARAAHELSGRPAGALPRRRPPHPPPPPARPPAPAAGSPRAAGTPRAPRATSPRTRRGAPASCPLGASRTPTSRASWRRGRS
jgi:hypothetical protein